MVKSPHIRSKENISPVSNRRKPSYPMYYVSRDLLEDNGMWPDKCLQDLSRKLGLQASGVREELITRLRLWHVSKHDGKGFQGSNFYLLPVKDNTVLPQFLSPFRKIEAHEHRSILRKRGRDLFGTPTDEEVAATSPRRNRKKKKLVQFSPYNRVQLISPRRAGDNEHVRKLYQSIQEGEYENSDDEEEVWSRSNSGTSDDIVSGNSTPTEETDEDPTGSYEN